MPLASWQGERGGVRQPGGEDWPLPGCGKVTFPRIGGLSAEQQHWLRPVVWKQVPCMWAPPPSPLPSWGSVAECASEPQVNCLCHTCGSKLGLGPTLSPSTADLESNPTELPDSLTVFCQVPWALRIQGEPTCSYLQGLHWGHDAFRRDEGWLLVLVRDSKSRNLHEPPSRSQSLRLGKGRRYLAS